MLEDEKEVIFTTTLVDTNPKQPEVWNFNYSTFSNPFFPSNNEYETLSLTIYEEVNLKQPFLTKINVKNEKTLISEYISTSSTSFLDEWIENIEYNIKYNNGQTQNIVHDKTIKTTSTKEINLDQKAYDIKDVTITINYSESELGSIVTPKDEFISNYDNLILEINELKPSSNLGLILGLTFGLLFVLIIGVIAYLKRDKIQEYYSRWQRKNQQKKKKWCHCWINK